MGSILGLLVVLLIIVVLLKIVRRAETGANTSGFGLASSIISSVLTSLGAPSRIVVNGRTYASVDEMPPEVREQYEQAMGLAISVTTDRNGILEFPRRARALRASAAAASAQTDAATRMKQLQEMKDSGLITTEEYEAKRIQILEAL